MFQTVAGLVALTFPKVVVGVATRFSGCGIFGYRFTGNFLLHLMGKES